MLETLATIVAGPCAATALGLPPAAAQASPSTRFNALGPKERTEPCAS
jgi:hypothetical protein